MAGTGSAVPAGVETVPSILWRRNSPALSRTRESGQSQFIGYG